MLIKKSYKFRLYPNQDQIILMSKHFGATRFVWNHFFALRKNAYLENKEHLSYYDNAKALTLLKKDSRFEWLKEINAQSLQASLADLDTAYGRFFKKQSLFPKFKMKHKSIDSFRCPQRVEIRGKKGLK